MAGCSIGGRHTVQQHAKQQSQEQDICTADAQATVPAFGLLGVEGHCDGAHAECAFRGIQCRRLYVQSMSPAYSIMHVCQQRNAWTLLDDESCSLPCIHAVGTHLTRS